MNSRRPGRALASWGLAGLPLVMILGQSLLALLGENAQSTGLVAVIGPLYDVAVLYEAAVVFKASPALVVGLFALITVGWVGEGVAIAVRPHRDAAFAAAGFVSLLFVVLFFGVYSELFGAGLPAGQLVGFFSIPVVTSGLVVAAAVARDWELDVVESAGAEAGESEAELERVRDQFETLFEERIGDPDAIRSVAPSAAEAATERRDEFHARWDDVRSALHGVQSAESAAAAKRDLSSVRQRLSELDPESAVTAADEAARRRLESAIRTTYGDVDVRAADGGSYTVVNLPTRFRELSLSGTAHPVHIGEASEVLLGRLGDGDRLEDVAAATREVDARLDSIREHVSEREEAVLTHLRAVETATETLEGQLDRLDGRVRDRATELLLDGRSDALAGVPDVRERSDEARQSLYACRFDDAERLASAAAADGERLTTASELLRGLSATSAGGRVSLPDSVPTAFVAEISEAFRREHGAPLDVTADESAVVVGESGDDDGVDGPDADEVEADDAVAPTETASPNAESDGEFAETATEARPEQVVDEVLYAFRELDRCARASGDDHLQFQTDDLPPSVARPEVLKTLRDYAEHQSDLVSHVELQSLTPPAFLEFEPQSGLSVREAIDGLEERYRERYA